jgi:hypothetical protein
VYESTASPDHVTQDAWEARRQPQFGPDPQETGRDAQLLGRDVDARMMWNNSIEALLPTHTCLGDSGETPHKWTTRLGTWKLQLDARMYQRIGVTVTGPGGTWRLADHRVEYVAAFLRLVGAIE